MNESVKGILLQAVHTASGESRLIDDLELTTHCQEEVSDEREITNASIREILEALHGAEDSPVTVVVGKERLRCFDSTVMSASYAEALNYAAEGDSLQTISATVRKESRVYPRPCLTDMFRSAPYHLEAEELQATIQTLVMDSSDYKDICRATASNGDVYLYSERYLNRARAEYLAEWESVGCFECQ